MALQFRFVSIVLAVLAVFVVACALPGLGQAPPRAPAPAVASGRISGTVIDQSGAVVSGALVSLTEKDQSARDPSAARQMLSGDDGQFSFADVVAGGFQLTITAAGFASQTSPGILRPGEVQILPPVTLGVAATSTDVEVGLTRAEVAEEEIKVQEKQRVLGVLPNFYVSYVADPVPLTAKQKFEIAWKTLIDPATLIFVGGAAGIEQAQNHFEEYGQGADGYGKRFGAGYADTATGTLIGSALLPSLLKQDPRYFYKGTGTTRSRFLYAVANSFICKGDNGRWQPSYSNILGSLAAGGISNLYYPSRDRNGAGLTFENGAIGIGATAAANVFQEFIVRKLTPKVPHPDPGKP
jgi:Carboxypeptidase regulatory-like domain